MEVTGRTKSTSRVTEQIKRKTCVQDTFDDLETIVMKKTMHYTAMLSMTN